MASSEIRKFFGWMCMLLFACGDAPPPIDFEAPRLPATAFLNQTLQTLQTKLLAPDKESYDRFGIAVAISADGSIALIGAPGQAGKGAVYVFAKSGSTWTRQQTLLASDRAYSDGFGTSVSLSSDGSIALIGSPQCGSSCTGSGKAYVFARNGLNWTQQQILVASDKKFQDYFGGSVALSGDGKTALVGAFRKNYESMVVTIACGAAYVFSYNGGVWGQAAKLLAADKSPSAYFGFSVALSSDGNLALVGANQSSDSGTANNGAAYLFIRSGITWGQQQKLLAADKANYNGFGSAVSLSSTGNTLLVGANHTADSGTTNNGAAYLFTKSGTIWSQQQKLLADDRASNDEFGGAISLSSDASIAMVGAMHRSDNGTTSNGAVYLFAKGGATWSQQQKLLAFDKASNDMLGMSVALSSDGSTSLIGASDTSDSGTINNGAVYPFVPAALGARCSGNGDCRSGYCVDAVCCNTACGGGVTSDCQACSVATGAVVDGNCGPLASGAICRSATGVCDVAEKCDGASTACPDDSLAQTTTVCRPSTGPNDPADFCNGVSATQCPDVKNQEMRTTSNGCSCSVRGQGDSGAASWAWLALFMFGGLMTIRSRIFPRSERRNRPANAMPPC